MNFKIQGPLVYFEVRFGYFPLTNSFESTSFLDFLRKILVSHPSDTFPQAREHGHAGLFSSFPVPNRKTLLTLHSYRHEALEKPGA